MAIAQDKLGRMWLGTREGINVYDGVGIIAYKGWSNHSPDNQRIWLGNEVRSIVTDSIGDIFFLIDENLVKYDLNGDFFTTLSKTGQVMALGENKGEVIFVARDSVYVKRPDAPRPTLAFTIPEASKLTNLSADDANFYVATPDGLYVYDRSNGSHHVLLPGTEIYSSFVARDGTLWITTINKGLYRLRRDDANPVAVSMPTPLEGALGAGQCRNAIEDHNGKIWYGSFSGLFCYDPATDETRHIKIPLSIGGLTHQSVFGMACDRKGNIWVGTYYGGVNYFSPTYDKFLNFTHDGFGSTDLSNTLVKDMVVDRDGHLWFATDGAGVGCLDENWNITTHLFTHSTGKALRQNNIRCLEYDPESNRLFIGTHLGGLSIYDIDRGKVTNLIDNPLYQETPGDIIHKIKIHNGNLIIASKTGISWMELATGKIRKIKSDIVSPLVDIDDDGNIYARLTNSQTILKISNPTSDDLAIDTISKGINIYPAQILATPQGLLVTTLGNGIVCFPADGSPHRLINTSNSRLPDDYCYAISPGSGDNVYVTTANNVVKLNLADLSTQSVNFADLFPNSHIINECALLSLDNGEILVGSTKGITRLNSSNFTNAADDDDTPAIFFSRLRLQNKEVTAADGSGVLEHPLPLSDKITLPNNHNDVSFIIGVRDYLATTGAPEIEYRMDGIDSRWLTASGNEINYQNLPPGSYRLRARQHDGEEIALDVTVSTPWYNSWWAWLLYIAVAVAVGYFIIHKTLDAARLRSSLKKEKTERAQIERLNQEKFVFFTNVSHEFQTPLTLIISHIDLLISRYKRHPKLIEGLTRIRAHSEQMSHLITQLLEFRKLQQNRQVLRVGMHDANELLRETATPFADYAIKRDIDFTIKTSDDNPRGAYDTALLNRVLVNIISNAFKYTPDGGKITCSVSSTPTGKVVFEVEDTGRGIDEKDLPYIFDRFYNGTVEELKRYNVDYRSTGIGLAFAKSIVDKHHGTITVESQPGVGTVFRVVIPGSLDIFNGDDNVVIETQSIYTFPPQLPNC